MASAIEYRRGAAGVLAVALTSVLIWFGNGLDPWWPLLWFAPLPVLVFGARSSWPGAALAAFAASVAGGFNKWHYFQVLGAPPFAWAGTVLIAALAFASAVSLFRALLKRGAAWSALLAFPATLVSYEYAGNLVSPHGTAGSLAYTQLEFLPLLQLASVTGPWGVSFLLLLFPSALAIGLLLRRPAPQQARHAVATSLGAIALVLIFGAARLALPQPSERVTVGLIASDRPAGVAEDGPQTERLFRAYAAEAEKLSARGAEVIVMPEKLGVVVDPYARSADAIFQSVADRTQATIVAGLIHVSQPLKYNRARAYAPGAPVLAYDKRHMLPPFESQFEPGASLTLLPRASGTWGVAICKDMDFTPLSRQYGQAGVGLMLAPAWDFDLDRWWHGHMAVMRGVENGFTVARAARNGYLTVSDNRGRILAETRSDSAAFAALVTEAPAAHDATVYTLLGDWFAWLALAVLLLTLGQFHRLSRRPPVASVPEVAVSPGSVR